MAYHDSKCPCGGKKPTDTMLCDDCNAAFADHPEMKAFNDAFTFRTDARRSAAIVLLNLSRRRKTAREPYLSTIHKPATTATTP